MAETVTAGNIRQKLSDIFIGSEETRKILNVSPHFVPLDINIISATLSKVLDTSVMSVDEFHKKLSAYIKNKTRTYTSLVSKGGRLYYNNDTLVTISNLKSYTPAVVSEDNTDNIKGLLYYNASNSYLSLYNGIFRSFLNTAEIVAALKQQQYANTQLTPKFEIGHTFLEGISTTPSMQQFSGLEEAVRSNIDQASGEQLQILKSLQSQLTDLKAAFTIHTEYSKTIDTNLTKNFKDSILSITANIVIIQDRAENRSFGTYETKLLTEAKKLLLNVNFSRNLIEEIQYRVVETLKGNKVSSTTSKLKIPTLKQESKNTSITTVKPNIALPKLRTTTGQFTSLVSLQNLLNQGLASQIQKNMGTGERRDILNYRTGRFAESAKVQKMSQSREGMITAFYSYMRNPYGTFSAGGAQEDPATRDPKLLISRSIREIGATMVGNRMRAVLV